jgi:integrase
MFNILSEKACLTIEYTARSRGKTRQTTNVWEAVTRKTHPKNGRGREPLTTSELVEVCTKAEGELRTMLAIGIYLGARMGDAATLQWGAADMVKRTIRYIPRKLSHGNDPTTLEIPMHPELYGVLAETPAKKRKGAILPTMASLYEGKGPYAVSKIVQDHFKDCGLTTTRKAKGNGTRRLVSRGFHSLRHTAVSVMRNSGAALPTSQAVVGHSSPEIHDLYTHADTEALQRAIYALPSITGQEVAEQREPLPEWAVELVESLTTKNVKTIKAELLKGGAE